MPFSRLHIFIDAAYGTKFSIVDSVLENCYQKSIYK